MRLSVVLIACLVVSACGKKDPTPDGARPPADQLVRGDTGRSDGPHDGSGPEVVCTFGSKQPTAPVINPDDPDYQDATWTKAEVQAKFATAKAQNAPSYRAYKVAHALSDLLLCAFCACGCSSSDGHRSAVDCFKDMHGFG